MRKRNLIMLSVLALCASTVIFMSGCGDNSETASADSVKAANAATEDTVMNVDENADNSAAQGETETAADYADNEGTDAAVTTVATKKTKVKYDKEAPWESFDMYGLPDKLDLLKKDNGDVLVLVNKLHAVSKYYEPTDMVAINGNFTTNQGLEMKEDAYKAFKKMRKAARADGIYFKICSAYRTYETQKWLYKNYLNTMGKELRDIRSAAPGRSEHHTGYAIDLVTKSTGWTLTQDFAKTDEGKWIKKNCAKYGYIIRYPKGKTDITGYDYEPWHLRYVGVDVAKEITKQDITLEEYLKR